MPRAYSWESEEEKNAQQLMRQGYSLTASEKYEAALKKFQEAYELTPDNGMIRVRIFECKESFCEKMMKYSDEQCKRGRYKEASELYQTALSIAPSERLIKKVQEKAEQCNEKIESMEKNIKKEINTIADN